MTPTPEAPVTRPNPSAARPHRVVILGGGFAGVYAASELERRMRRSERSRVEITLVSRDNYVTFQPLLPEVISGSVDMLHVISPIRRLAKRTRLLTREIESVDVERKVVRLAPGVRPVGLEIPYDTLVVALGTRLDGSRIPGVPEHALPFKYLGDALRLRNRIVRMLEEAECERDPALRRALLTFVVAGGGFSGVECAAEMHAFLEDARRSYPSIRPDEVRVTLLQRGERILPELTEPLARFAHDVLAKRGIDIRLHAGLRSLSAATVVVEDARTREVTRIDARTCVATVPAGPHPLVASLPLPQERGRLLADATLGVRGHPDVFALGDCALVPQADGTPAPPTAQHALRQARTCADNVLADLRGKPRSAFSFRGLGKLGSLGHRSAVAEVLGVRLKGLPAWLLWRGVYVTKFPGFDRQVRLLVDWMLDAVLPRDITGLRVFREEAVHREHFEAGETVFAEGDHGDQVYVVVGGEADVRRNGEVVATVGARGVFGETALLSSRPRNASVVARTPLDVVTVRRDAFRELVERLPGVADAMGAIQATPAAAASAQNATDRIAASLAAG